MTHFTAVFNGTNRYTFKKILPQIGHSYLREIILDANNRIVTYRLRDLNSNVDPELFKLGKDYLNGNVRNDQEKQEIIKV
jgi:hypothetical protein